MIKRIARSTPDEDPVAVEAEQLAAGHVVRQLGIAEIELEAGSQSGPRAGELASAAMRLYAEWARVMVGRSNRELPAKDPRFSDPAWRDHPLYRRLGKVISPFATQLTPLPAKARTGASVSAPSS